ncbi:MAG: hypothetical protein JXB32_22165 [Deltaproteobacteria bacterium]|nr:hypothetical protein [Deltaproteobacteria bacterium]
MREDRRRSHLTIVAALLAAGLLPTACGGGGSAGDVPDGDAPSDIGDDAARDEASAPDDGDLGDDGTLPDTSDDGSADDGGCPDCSYLDNPCGRGTCIEGACQIVPDGMGEGMPCGTDPCTDYRVCRYGLCVPEAPLDCSHLDGPCTTGVCDPTSWPDCAVETAADGTACDDGDPETTGDACAAGACVGTPAADDCAAATALGDSSGLPGEATVSGADTTGATDDFSAHCGGDGAADEVYTFGISDRALVRFELSTEAPLVLTLARGDCAEGPADAVEIFCLAGPSVRADRILEPGRYFLIVDGATAGDAGPYELSLRHLWGHIVLIGHDFTTRSPSADRILANAVRLANDEDPIDILEYVQYADTAPDHEVEHARAAIREAFAPPSARTVLFDTLTDSADLSARIGSADVLLVHEQEARPDVTTLNDIGTAWGSTLTSFVERGGILVVLDAYGSESYRLVRSSSLLAGTGLDTIITTVQLRVAATSDPVGAGVPSPYDPPLATVSWSPGVPGTAVVMTNDTRMRIVVFHTWHP